MRIIAVLALGFMFAFSACKTTKQVPTDPSTTITKDKEAWTPKKVLEHTFDFQTFNGRADLHINYKDLDHGATLNLRMEKGKKVWASVVAMGIAEVGRALITPDNIQGLFRLGKDAYDLSFQETVNSLGAPIEFEHLENLLLGNPIISKGKIENIKDRAGTLTFDVVEGDYVQHISFNQKTQQITQMVLKNAKQQFEATVHLSDYVNLGTNQIFATNKKIIIESPGNNMELSINFRNQGINVPVETPYSVPNSYKVKKKI